MTGFARALLLPGATLIGPLSALLTRPVYPQQLTALDPLLPSKIGAVNEREAREGGLRLKTRLCPEPALPMERRLSRCGRNAQLAPDAPQVIDL
jgi:hypothetical protein